MLPHRHGHRSHQPLDVAGGEPALLGTAVSLNPF